MQFNIQQYISNFVSSQFPQFYKTEGPTFIIFLQAYYQFLEQQYGVTYAANGAPLATNPLYQARNLLNYRDIDNTLAAFLQHFQKKYLYGIPFNVIINKRFLLKHVLDVYRSKGSIQCYRLLFKLIYNEDIEIYLPGVDLLAPSDGTWYVPTYIEVTNVANLQNLVGKTILGLSSNSTAVVESYITEAINSNIIASLYITHLQPKGGAFIKGEKVIDNSLARSPMLSSIVAAAPIITGSLNTLQIINGGQGFNIGDLLGIVHRDVSNNNLISFGVNGVLKVTGLTQAFGTLTFSITKSGFGITSTPTILVYPGNGNTAGNGASFQIGAISNTEPITYNTDVIGNYLTTLMNASQYNFPANATANLTSNIGVAFSYTSNTFGSLIALSNILTGNGYIEQANVFVESVENSLVLPGTVTYSNSSAANTVTGTGTNFTWYFSNTGMNSFIQLQANSSANSVEYQAILNVANDTSMTLYGTPKFNSNGTSAFYVAPAIIPANFTPYDQPTFNSDGSINGLNSLVSAYPSIGNTVVGAVTSYNSGKAYLDGEQVILYLYSGIATPTIVNGGTKYTNGDGLVFIAGGGVSPNGFISTNTTGGITAAVLTYNGSGLQNIPTIRVQSNTGSGAILTTSLVPFNTLSQVIGRVVKGGVGKAPGYWTTTKGMLSMDKFIQDSFFYQDYSYQIRAASQLAQYQSILYKTFHPSGAELFGEFQIIDTIATHANLNFDLAIANNAIVSWLTVDRTDITVDAANTTVTPAKYTVDEVLVSFLTADEVNWTVDSTIITADETY